MTSDGNIEPSSLISTPASLSDRSVFSDVSTPGEYFGQTPGTGDDGPITPFTPPDSSIDPVGIPLRFSPKTPTKKIQTIGLFRLLGEQSLDSNDDVEHVESLNSARAFKVKIPSKGRAHESESGSSPALENTRSENKLNVTSRDFDFQALSVAERKKGSGPDPAIPALVPQIKIEPTAPVPEVKVESIQKNTQIKSEPTAPAPKITVESIQTNTQIKIESRAPAPKITIEPTVTVPKVKVESTQTNTQIKIEPTTPITRIKFESTQTNTKIKVEPTSPVPKIRLESTHSAPTFNVEQINPSVPFSIIKRLFPLALQGKNTPLTNKVLTVVQELSKAEAILEAERGMQGVSIMTTRREEPTSIIKKINWPHKQFSRLLSDETVERLIEEPQRCIASIQGFPRRQCSRGTGGFHGVNPLLTELCKLQAPCQLSTALKCAKEFVGGSTCWQHRAMATDEWEIWRDQFTKAKQADHSSSQELACEAELAFIKRWAGISTAGNPFERQRDGSILVAQDMKREVHASVYIEQLLASDTTVQASVNTTSTYTSNQQTAVAVRKDPLLGKQAEVKLSQERSKSYHLNHHLVPYRRGMGARLSTEEFIRQTLTAPLTPGDRDKFGFIYVFWHIGSFGWVKIGYATDVPVRHRQWAEQCKVKDVQEAMHSDAKYHVIPVQHRLRVERLVQAELKDERREEPCCRGCGVDHKEWFEVSQQRALKVVEKWTDWIWRRQPYDLSTGMLKAEITPEEIDALCTGRTSVVVDRGSEAVSVQPVRPNVLRSAASRKKSRNGKSVSRAKGVKEPFLSWSFDIGSAMDALWVVEQ